MFSRPPQGQDGQLGATRTIRVAIVRQERAVGVECHAGGKLTALWKAALRLAYWGRRTFHVKSSAFSSAAQHIDAQAIE
jgi:hypothetical protein